MYRIKTFNKIDPAGLARLDPARYEVGEAVAAIVRACSDTIFCARPFDTIGFMRSV